MDEREGKTRRPEYEIVKKEGRRRQGVTVGEEENTEDKGKEKEGRTRGKGRAEVGKRSEGMRMGGQKDIPYYLVVHTGPDVESTSLLVLVWGTDSSK